MTKKPVVFDYMEARAYLQDYYSYRKNSDEGFSYETWSVELKYSSRSYLRMVLIGKKKISDGFTSAFCQSQKFTKAESEYFEVLTRYSQSGTQSTRQAFSQKLFQILREHTGQSEVADYAEFVATPFLPRLLTMLSFQDIRPVPATFARLLGVDLHQVTSALEKLKAMGLAETENAEGEIHWKSLKRRFKIPDQVGNQAMIGFHKQSLADASQALSESKENRRFKSLILPLSSDELNQLYTLLDSFSSEQIARFNSDNYQDRRLFQLNMNIHAVAEADQSKV